MAIDLDKLLALTIPAAEHSYGARDAILYALGVGCGHDPLDPHDLGFVYERGLRLLPSFALVLGYPGFWIRDLPTGIDWVRLVLGEQGLRLHRPLPAAATVIGRTRVVDVIDKGPGKGALVLTERSVVDKASGDLIATVTQTTFCRADGGFGGPARESPRPHPIPDRAPDFVCDLPTRPEAALIYRLSGDMNPLHADPAVARDAGFPRPILHGLATFGVAMRALVRTLCADAPERLTAASVRFSSPVFPGETIRTEIWRDGGVISFRARVPERDVTAINNGRAEVGA